MQDTPLPATVKALFEEHGALVSKMFGREPPKLDAAEQARLDEVRKRLDAWYTANNWIGSALQEQLKTAKADVAALREAIGVVVPTVIRCFIQARLDDGLTEDDLDITSGRATLERVEKAMRETSKGQSRQDAIGALQQQVADTWTLDSYSDAVRANTLSHRDFQHALVHVMKAAGKLAHTVDEAEHERPRWHAGDEKYLADLVISAVRMANVWPVGRIDLAPVIRARLDRNVVENLPVASAAAEPKGGAR